MGASGISILDAGWRGGQNPGWITGFQNSSAIVSETAKRQPRSTLLAGPVLVVWECQVPDEEAAARVLGPFLREAEGYSAGAGTKGM